MALSVSPHSCRLDQMSLVWLLALGMLNPDWTVQRWGDATIHLASQSPHLATLALPHIVCTQEPAVRAVRDGAERGVLPDAEKFVYSGHGPRTKSFSHILALFREYPLG